MRGITDALVGYFVLEPSNVFKREVKALQVTIVGYPRTSFKNSAVMTKTTNTTLAVAKQGRK